MHSVWAGTVSGQTIMGSCWMNLEQAYYELKFELSFRQAKGDSFQEFFEKLMSMAYRGDFVPCRPWGNIGDKKNDGFLKSEKRLFQVYAPNEMEANRAKAKITEDFDGAKKHWGQYFEKWSFVHNATDGLPPHVHELLLAFESQNPKIKVDPWGLEELRVVFRRLDIDDRQSWLGLAPTEETKARLGFSDLEPVLEGLSVAGTVDVDEVKSVPAGKIEWNKLSEPVATLIKQGMIKSPLVQKFFEQWHDPTLGQRIATSFKDKYLQLRKDFAPDRIFSELQAWAGGDLRGSPTHEFAVIAVMAYYFERCDIFEEPPDKKQ